MAACNLKRHLAETGVHYRKVLQGHVIQTEDYRRGANHIAENLNVKAMVKSLCLTKHHAMKTNSSHNLSTTP